MNGRHIMLSFVLLLCACTLPAAAHTVIEAPSGTVAAGSTATFLLGIGDVTDIEGAAFTLTWDPEQFTITAITAADGDPALRTVSTIRNDEGFAKVVVTCPAGITVETDACEPVLAVTISAGNETGTAPVGFTMAEYSTGFLPFVFDEAAEGVITITTEEQPVPAPAAAFSATPVTGTAPLTVTFADQSTGTPTTWSWTFGDGATSSEANPVHTYESAGTYDVTLTVTNPGGSDTMTREGHISAVVPAPLASFSAVETSGTVPLTVSFTDSSSGDYLTYSWDFGDGTTSSEASPVHTYTSAGTYDVSLTVMNYRTDISDTMTREGYITASLPTPVAGFSADDTSGTIPLTVSFTDSSSGIDLAYSWDFGDGATATVQDPVHTYTAAGTYTVQLKVTGEGGSDTATRSGYIIVTEAADCPLDADFTASVITGPAPLEVTFSDASTGSPDRWWWWFGDDTTANGRNPVHVYTTPGTYTVSLFVGDGVNLNRETKVAYIVVTDAGPAAPAASFSATPVAGTTPLTVTFTDTSTDAAAWSWDFGDGTTATVQHPEHTYTAPDTYTVRLTVTNPGGSDTMTREGYISAVLPDAPVSAPVAGFSAVDTSGTIPLTVSFTDSSSGMDLAYVWDFGDGATSSDANPVHTYQAPGTYTVRLTVINNAGSNTMTREGYISVSSGSETPVANFYTLGGTPVANEITTFMDISTDADGSIVSWLWDFGDGSIAANRVASHTYALAGNYDVSLTVIDSDGLSATKTKTIRVVEETSSTSYIRIS